MRRRQVNAAASPTPWKLNLFLEYHKDSEHILKGGDVIRLYHADQEKVSPRRRAVREADRRRRRCRSS